MIITSRNNPTVKRILSLQEKKYRSLYKEYIVEGEKMVAECIACRKQITLVVRAESASEFFVPSALPVLDVSDGVFSLLSGEKTPQGVLCLVRTEDVFPVPPQKSCLLLDGVSDPGNLGTVIRTANASGYEEVYLLHCTDPFSPKAVRASMSGIFHVKAYIGSEEEIFSALEGTPIVAADLNGENIFRFRPPEKFCLAIGNEGHGISEATKARKQYTVTIPMRSTQESLNAGVSAGIAMYLLRSAEFQAKN